VGLEDEAGSAANIAGYWVQGIAKGMIVLMVPMFVIGVGAGFLRKAIQAGTGMGGN
jgi:hypothetical protein